MSKEAHLCYLVSERQTEECVQLLFFQLYHEGSHEGVELHSVRTLHLGKHNVTRVQLSGNCNIKNFVLIVYNQNYKYLFCPLA